jgi:hypothetical protein
MKPRKQQPPKSPVDHPSRTPGSRWETVGLVAAALVGIGCLVRFGHSVANHNAKHEQVKDDAIVRAEILTLYASQRLIDFCRNHDLCAIASRDELMCLIECDGLENSWYGSTVRLFQANGRSRDSSGWGSLTDSSFRHNLAVLRTLAGRPPQTPKLDYSRAKIVVIPHQRENEDPLMVLEQLLMRPEGMEATGAP